MIAIIERAYSTRIIKASALLADTETLFAYWDELASVQENLRRARNDNIFGKASRSRVEDVLSILRRRYFQNPPVYRALIALVRARMPAEVLRPILYYFSARSDRLLHDVITEIIRPMKERGESEVRVDDLIEVLAKWVRDGRTYGQWSQATTRRVAEGVLCTLRDFGVLRGSKKKSINSIYLPVKAFAFIALDLRKTQASGNLVLHHPDWQLFFLSVHDTERLFVQAHQEKLLEYQAAGPVIRIAFPSENLEEYAYALAQRQDLTS